MRSEAALGGLIVYYISYAFFYSQSEDQDGSVGSFRFPICRIMQTVGGGIILEDFSQIPLVGLSSVALKVSS